MVICFHFHDIPPHEVPWVSAFCVALTETDWSPIPPLLKRTHNSHSVWKREFSSCKMFTGHYDTHRHYTLDSIKSSEHSGWVCLQCTLTILYSRVKKEGTPSFVKLWLLVSLYVTEDGALFGLARTRAGGGEAGHASSLAPHGGGDTN